MHATRSHLCAIAAIAVALAACAREPPDSMGNVTLRGRVVALKGRHVGAAVSALGPEAATRIVVTTGEGYEVHDVVAGAFEFPVPTNRTVGLLLVGPSDESLGFVTVRDSIPGVPMSAIDPGVSSIDLGTLVASGAVVSPGIDPIGNGLTLDEAEIGALAALGVVARGLLADPDVDDDGVVDLLQAREYRLQTAVFRQGTFSGTVGQQAGPVSGWSLGVNVADGTVGGYPTSATVTGPVGSGVDGLVVQGMMGNSQNIGYGIPLPVPGVAPAAGTWTLTFGSRTLTFELGELSGIAASAPALEPSVVLNADQTLQRVDWLFRMPDGTTTPAGSKLAVDVRIQISANPPAMRCPASNLTSFASDTVYSMAIDLDEAGGSHVLACQDIPWSAVVGLEIAYMDVFGGSHVFGYTP